MTATETTVVRLTKEDLDAIQAAINTRLDMLEAAMAGSGSIDGEKFWQDRIKALMIADRKIERARELG